MTEASEVCIVEYFKMRCFVMDTLRLRLIAIHAGFELLKRRAAMEMKREIGLGL